MGPAQLLVPVQARPFSQWSGKLPGDSWGSLGAKAHPPLEPGRVGKRAFLSFVLGWGEGNPCFSPRDTP